MMAYYSLAFLAFVVIFIILHGLIGDIAPRFQWVIRLIAGLSFFAYVSGINIIFIMVSAVSIWYGGLLLYGISKKGKELRKSSDISTEEKKALKSKTQMRMRLVLFALVAFNIGLLIYAKYVSPSTHHPIALPLGISFYSLMAVSYLVDVYGEKYEPQKNFGKMLLYLCWFPQLIQGPINRYDTLKETLYGEYRLHAPQFRTAVYLFLFGAVKKYAIADLLAPIVNACLNNNSAQYPGSYLLFGAFLFAVEQYADFSGGIDMSVAVSLLFGVKMDENFRQPYFSTSLANFWRRWHISLGSWMRDYVFYPFATLKPVSKLNRYVSKRFGNHAGRAVIGGISNILVFALVGLWHGREYHYLLWGLYNGFIIAISDALEPAFSRLNRFFGIKEDSRLMFCFRVLRTFMIVVFAGYFDVIGPVRTGLACFVNTFASFKALTGIQMIGALFTDNITSVQGIVTAGIATVLLIIYSTLRERGISPVDRICTRAFYVRWTVFFPLLGLLLYSFTCSSGMRGFMYAAF